MFFSPSAQRAVMVSVVGALTILWPAFGLGSTIIDFNFINVDSTHPTAFSGVALVGSSGDIWNSVGAHWSNPVTPQVFSDLALNDTSNNPTPVKMDFTAESFFGKLAGHDLRTWAFDGTPYEPLMDQYAYSEVGHATTSLTLKNLIPGLFDLYIYSSGSPDAVARISQFTVTTSNGSAVASAGPDGGVNTFEEGVNYVHFRPIVGNDGQISISGLGI